jgi:hypothetical protein
MASQDDNTKTWPVRVFLDKTLAKEYVQVLRNCASDHPSLTSSSTTRDEYEQKAREVRERLARIEGRTVERVSNTESHPHICYYLANRPISVEVSNRLSSINIDSDADSALDQLYEYNPSGKALKIKLKTLCNIRHRKTTM